MLSVRSLANIRHPAHPESERTGLQPGPCSLLAPPGETSTKLTCSYVPRWGRGRPTYQAGPPRR